MSLSGDMFCVGVDRSQTITIFCCSVRPWATWGGGGGGGGAFTLKRKQKHLKDLANCPSVFAALSNVDNQRHILISSTQWPIRNVAVFQNSLTAESTRVLQARESSHKCRRDVRK